MEENEYITEISEINPSAIVVGESHGKEPVLIYSKEKIIEKLMQDGCSYDEALEFYDFNILGAYINEHMPIFMWGE